MDVNPASSETGILQGNLVNIIAANWSGSLHG